MRNRPTVSVVLAVLNEEKTLHDVLTSVLSQDGAFDLVDILVVDGGSTDASPEIAARFAQRDPRIRLLHNPKRRAPFAFNIGIREARGEYVTIFGAHASYDSHYIDTCLRELQRTGSVGCSGRVITIPGADTAEARVCSWVLASPFGSSTRSFRTQPEGLSDTVAYPVFRRRALLDVGCYDETLLRNQDNDMNQKLRQRGDTLWCTWRATAYYRPQSTIRGLCRYAFQNGLWNVVSLSRNRASMGLRHFVPLLFVIAVFVLLGVAVAGIAAGYGWLAAAPLLAMIGVYGLGSSLAALVVAARERSGLTLLMPPIFFLFHFSYGLGSLRGLLGGARNTLQE